MAKLEDTTVTLHEMAAAMMDVIQTAMDADPNAGAIAITALAESLWIVAKKKTEENIPKADIAELLSPGYKKRAGKE